MKTFCAITLLAFITTSCFRVGPEYHSPNTCMPDSWSQTLNYGLDDEAPPLEDWWNVFNDQQLTDLIQKADLNNLSIKEALARIAESRAIIKTVSSEYYPDVNSLGSAQKIRASKGFPIPTIDQKNIYHRLSLSVLDSTWEIDFWGRISYKVDSAVSNWQATVEDYRDALVSLYAEVAGTYYSIRTLQQQVFNANKNSQNQRESLFIAQAKFNAELTSEIDVFQAQLNLSITESAIPKYESLLAGAINSLAVLLGEFPGPLQDEFMVVQNIPEMPQSIPICLPANLLRQRPDIRATERNYAAEFYLIGAARAELFPQFGLSGMLGFLGEVDIFEKSKKMWAYGIGYAWNLFDGGRIQGEIEAQIARAWQAKYQYEQTVLEAVEEVESAMAAYIKELERREKLRETVIAAQKSVDLVTYQYRVGLAGFFVVLVMQEALFDQQELFIESEGLVVQNLIRIYKALGGGWNLE